MLSCKIRWDTIYEHIACLRSYSVDFEQSRGGINIHKVSLTIILSVPIFSRELNKAPSVEDFSDRDTSAGRNVALNDTSSPTLKFS